MKRVSKRATRRIKKIIRTKGGGEERTETAEKRN